MRTGLRKNYWTNSGKPCPGCGKPMYRFFGDKLTETYRCEGCDQVYMPLHGKLLTFEEWARLILRSSLQGYGKEER